mgnify:CR=1 FL=1
MKRKILLYEIVGIVFIIMLGSLLHFTYEISGDNALVGVFSAVNESVWEHLKLAFWPAMLFALIEFVPLKRFAQNFVLAKSVSVYVMVAVIPAIFYSYTAFTGENLLAVDIGSFLAAVVIGQLVSYKLLTYRTLSVKAQWIALFFVILLAVLFVVFTFVPPHLPIFEDPITGNYGIC